MSQLCPTLSRLHFSSTELTNLMQFGWLGVLLLSRTGRAKMGEGGLPGNGMLALLLRSVNSFLWDAAVSSRGGHKRQSRVEESEQAVWLYLWYCQTAAPGLNEGWLTRLNRKLSFTLVFGTFSYVLQRGINIVSTKVPLCPFCVKCQLMTQHFLF